MQISLIIPAFNEEEVIQDTLVEVLDFLKNNFQSFEIIVVDDASSDNTRMLVQKFPEIVLLRNLKNHGKGYSVAKGMRQAQGELLIFMDADNSTRIAELKTFLQFIPRYQVLIGSRAIAQAQVLARQALWKVFLGRLGNYLIQLFLLPGIKDTQCGFKLFTKDCKFIFEKLSIEDWGFDFELLFLLKKHKFKIKELPVAWKNNLDSKVKVSTYFKTLFQVIKVRLNYLFNQYKI